MRVFQNGSIFLAGHNQLFGLHLAVVQLPACPSLDLNLIKSKFNKLSKKFSEDNH